MAGDLRRQRGGALIDFVFAGLPILLLLLSSVEFGRLLLAYTTVANAARATVRYAMTHGSTRTGSGSNGPSGPSANPAQVVSVAKAYLKVAPLDDTKLNVNVSYPDGGNGPGSRVSVVLTYNYDPLTILPVSVPLSSSSQGIITF